jgi:hypothetical protein
MSPRVGRDIVGRVVPGDGAGSGVVEAIQLSLWPDPQVRTVGQPTIRPPAKGLDPVVQPAQRHQIVRAGLTRRTRVVIRNRVIQVGPVRCGTVAPGEDAHRVLELDVLTDPRRDLVGIHRQPLVQIDHRLDHHPVMPKQL